MEEEKLVQDEQVETTEQQQDKAPEQKADPEQEKQDGGADSKKFSQEEVDNIVKSRLDRELKKFKHELSEAEKLAKMTEEERAKLEMEKLKSEFEAEKKQFQKEKLELEATKILNREGLPVDFAPLLLGEDAGSTKSNIDSFKTAFQGAVEKAVEDKLKGGYKPKKAEGQAPGMTAEQFKAMTLSERQELAQKDPELYTRLKTQAKQG